MYARGCIGIGPERTGRGGAEREEVGRGGALLFELDLAMPMVGGAEISQGLVRTSFSFGWASSLRNAAEGGAALIRCGGLGGRIADELDPADGGGW